jgi:hypothetical protein
VASKRTITVTIRITNLRETLRKFNDLPKDADKEMRAASLSIAGAVAVQIRSAAGAQRQSALMVPTIRAQRDRVPTVVAGGTRRVGSNKVPAYKVLFGSEFGSKTLAQFRGFDSEGYWFFRTVDANREYFQQEWTEAADEVLKKWGGL